MGIMIFEVSRLTILEGILWGILGFLVLIKIRIKIRNRRDARLRRAQEAKTYDALYDQLRSEYHHAPADSYAKELALERLDVLLGQRDATPPSIDTLLNKHAFDEFKSNRAWEET